MSPTLRLALGAELGLWLPPLPPVQHPWRLRLSVDGLDVETLAWRRQQWAQRPWRSLFLELEGHGRFLARVEHEENTGPELAWLAFHLDAAPHRDLVAGALLGFGIDHPALRVQAVVRGAQRAPLLAGGGTLAGGPAAQAG